MALSYQVKIALIVLLLLLLFYILQPSPMSPYPPGGGLSPGAMPVHNSPYMNHSLQAQMGQHSPAISSPGLLQPPQGPGNLSPRPNSTGKCII